MGVVSAAVFAFGVIFSLLAVTLEEKMERKEAWNLAFMCWFVAAICFMLTLFPGLRSAPEIGVVGFVAVCVFCGLALRQMRFDRPSR